MPSYGHEAKSGFLWGIAGSASLTVVSMVASVVLARLLTPRDFGVAAAVGFFAQVAHRVTSLGFNSAIIQVPKLRDDHLSAVFTINASFGVGVGILLAALASPLGAFYQSPEAARTIPVAGLAFAISSVGAAPAALMARNLKFKQLIAIETANGWITSASSVLLAWWGFEDRSLIYSLLIGSTFDALVKLSLARWRPAFGVTKAALGELLSMGSGLYFKRLFDSLALNLDNMVIGRTLGLTELGIYDRAFTSMNRGVTLVSYAGPTLSLSVLARLQGDDERFRQAFRRLTVGIGIASYPAFMLLGVSAYPLFLIMFGPPWLAAVVPFQVLCAAGALKSYNVYVSSAVQAKGRVWGEVWRQIVYLALIVTGVALGSRWGLVGASVGVLFATVVMSALMGHLLCRVAGVSLVDLLIPHRTGLACAVGVVAATAATRWICGAFDFAPGPWTQLALDGSAGALSAAGFLLACPFSEGRHVVREMVTDFAPSVGRRLGLSPV